MYVFNIIDRFVNLYNVNDADCSKILSDFFINKRKKALKYIQHPERLIMMDDSIYFPLKFFPQYLEIFSSFDD